MNICLVSQEYPPETGWGGIGTYTYELAHGLAAIGHRTHVICRATSQPKIQQDTEQITIYRILPKLSLNRLPVLWRLNRIWEGYHLAVLLNLIGLYRAGSLDMIETPALHGEANLFQITYRHIPTVVRIHSCGPLVLALNQQRSSWSLRKSHWFEQQSIRFANALTAPSQAIVKDNRPYLPIGRREISVIPNPINPDRFDALGNETKSTHPPTVCYVGRLTQSKGAHILAMAMRTVWHHHPQAHFWYVGKDGPSPDGYSMHHWIEKQVPANKRANIRFLGHLDQESLPALYKQATLVVLPSLSESFGYICLEAMSAQRPVIATRCGGPEEIITDRETGLLINPNSPNELADAINTLLDSPAVAQQMGILGRQKIQERYHTQIIAKQMEKVFSSLVE